MTHRVDVDCDLQLVWSGAELRVTNTKPAFLLNVPASCVTVAHYTWLVSQYVEYFDDLVIACVPGSRRGALLRLWFGLSLSPNTSARRGRPEARRRVLVDG